MMRNASLYTSRSTVVDLIESTRDRHVAVMRRREHAPMRTTPSAAPSTDSPEAWPATAAGHADSAAPQRRHWQVRTVWLSDVHLGTNGCQAWALLDFLKHVECQQMYLVGDIIDGWQLKRSWHWPQAHSDVIQKLLRKVRQGTRMTFIAGNHDEFARRFLGISLGGIEVADEAVHTTVDGRRLWILHGDQFDGVIQCAKWLAHVGDVLYEFSLKLNRYLNIGRAWLGQPYWSVSQYLKHKVKRAVSYVGDFEHAVAREARRRGMDGVVCGHIHHPEMREIDGVLYANDGDWVESLSALVEHPDGRLEILRWPMMQAPRQEKKKRRQHAVGDTPSAPYTPDPLHILDDLMLPQAPTR